MDKNKTDCASINCPTCGYAIKEIGNLRCPRCNGSLLDALKCNGNCKNCAKKKK